MGLLDRARKLILKTDDRRCTRPRARFSSLVFFRPESTSRNTVWFVCVTGRSRIDMVTKHGKSKYASA